MSGPVEPRSSREGSAPTGPRRSDARRNRAAVLRVAQDLLSADPDLSMRAIAAAAGVSRSTLHRHFPSRTDLVAALREEALSTVRRAIRHAVEQRPPLAALRRLVRALVEVAAAYRLEASDAPPLEREADELGAELTTTLEELAAAADVEPLPPVEWLRMAAGELVALCLETGRREHADPDGAAERLFGSLTEPLDQGLVILGPDGALLAMNAVAETMLAPGGRPDPGERLTEPRTEILYEDGSVAPGPSYPLATAVRTGQAQPPTVRGHRDADGELRWVRLATRVLCRVGTGAVYGVIGVLSDVTPETEWEHERLLPAGELARAGAAPLDIVRALDEVPPHLFPDQLVSEARRLTGAPVALYVLDIDGSHLLRLAGTEEFPDRLTAPLALGPELATDGMPDLRARLEAELPGVTMAPMWLRGRAVGVLLSLRGSADDSLAELARHGAAAMELAGGYTDLFDAARRRKGTMAAAELQQSLLPPRIARLGAGELAGSVLPSYEVGGDWFDYVENRDGAWLAAADAVGKGPTAGALGGIALAALRAARRDDQSLEEATRSMHEAVCDVGRPEFFVTAIVARWHAIYSTFSWISCGHPPPLVVLADGTIEQLMKPAEPPLGLLERERRFTRHQRRLQQGERLIVHSDGITGRRTPEGVFGLDGIERAVAEAPARTATAIARAIQEAVMQATTDPLQDDAVAVVLAPDGPADSPA